MRTLRPTLGRGVCPGSTPSTYVTCLRDARDDGAKIDPVLRSGADCVQQAPSSERKGLPRQNGRPRVLPAVVIDSGQEFSDDSL